MTYDVLMGTLNPTHSVTRTHWFSHYAMTAQKAFISWAVTESEHTSRFLARGWVVYAPNALMSFAGTLYRVEHFRRTGGHSPTTFLNVFQRAAFVVA